jgi:hypothetical protein
MRERERDVHGREGQGGGGVRVEMTAEDRKVKNDLSAHCLIVSFQF